MTAATTAAPVTTRTHVGWGDLLWLTWRQHRWLVLATAAAVVAASALALGMAWHTDATGDTHELLGEYGYLGTAQALNLASTGMAAVIAVFWSAPLLSREYEQRTHLVVWSQDITALRWLTGKVVLLGVTAVAFAAGLGLALVKLMNSINATRADYPPFRPFDTSPFEAAPQVQVGYAAFGFALGLAFSAITRRTVLSMGLTLAVFFVTRSVVAGAWRPYFWEPLRKVEPYGTFAGDLGYRGRESDGSWMVDGHHSDALGAEIPFPRMCTDSKDHMGYVKCMTDSGVHYAGYYHPVDRLVPFQWFEFGVFAVLAAGLFALAFAWVRRARRA
ncbi:ABC transporter permease [Saccharothrix isguenensis]